MFKFAVILLLLGIIGSLFSGLYYLFRDQGSGPRTVKALTLRVGLSAALFILLMLGFYFGALPRQ